MKRSWILALLAAVVALVLVRPVAVTDTSADEARAAAVTLTDAVTFTRDVAPLLQQHCQECHRPGQIAPFARKRSMSVLASSISGKQTNFPRSRRHPCLP